MPCTLPAKRLYLRDAGLGKDISTEELSEFLSRYGKILEVKFVHNYAFVEYASESDAQLVYNIYRYEPLLGKRVVIQFARPLRKDIAAARHRAMAENWSPDRERSSPLAPSRENTSRHPVVVTGLSADLRWQELKDFGRSTGCLVAFCDLDRSDPDCGFLEYFTKEDAEYAIQSLDGKFLGGNVVRVLDYHDYSAERKKRRAHPRSPCRPIYPNRSTGLTKSEYGQLSPWGGYYQYEGDQGDYYPQVAEHPSPSAYPSIGGINGPEPSLVPQGSLIGGRCFPEANSSPGYYPGGGPFSKDLASTYDPRVQIGRFPDNLQTPRVTQLALCITLIFPFLLKFSIRIIHYQKQPGLFTS